MERYFLSKFETDNDYYDEQDSDINERRYAKASIMKSTFPLCSIKFITFCFLFFLNLVFMFGCANQNSGASAKNQNSVTNDVNKFLAERDKARQKTSKVLELTKKLPKEMADKELKPKLKDILHEIGRATRKDIPLIREATLLLRKQPNAIKVLSALYDSKPKQAHRQRLRILGLIGELQRREGIEVLEKIIWTPLQQEIPGSGDGLTPRDFEQIIQSKAVQGIAFFRNEEGKFNEKTDQILFKVMQSHPSRYVRISAIDSYMWNHGDRDVEANKIYKFLPKEFHKYIQRSRFYRNVNAKSFTLRLNTWNRKWAK